MQLFGPSSKNDLQTSKHIWIRGGGIKARSWVNLNFFKLCFPSAWKQIWFWKSAEFHLTVPLVSPKVEKFGGFFSIKEFFFYREIESELTAYGFSLTGEDRGSPSFPAVQKQFFHRWLADSSCTIPSLLTLFEYLWRTKIHVEKFLRKSISLYCFFTLHLKTSVTYLGLPLIIQFLSAKILFRWCIVNKVFSKLYSQYCFYHNIQTIYLENNPARSAGKFGCEKSPHREF